MPKHPPAIGKTVRLKGRLVSFNHSPRGGTESFLVELSIGKRVQVNFDPSLANLIHRHVSAGDEVTVTATLQPPDHRPSAHPVYVLAKLATPAGTVANQPAPVGPDAAVKVSGTVERLNYARHGEPNGAVLDTGDFVHLRPHGAAAANISVGSKLRAEGHARPLEFAPGRAIEASVANGVHIHDKKPKPGKRRH
jgi:hypothetical protein